MTISERLLELINRKSVTPYEISNNTGIAEATLSRLINGKTKKPNNYTLETLSKYFEINYEWLRTGKGDMQKKDVVAVIERPYSFNITPELKESHRETIKAKDELITVKDELIATKNELIAAKEAIIVSKENEISTLKAQLTEKDKRMGLDHVQQGDATCVVAR